jgi:restriction system protein
VNDEVDIDTTEIAPRRERLLDILLGLEPEAFERLCQRILREAGFIRWR